MFITLLRREWAEAKVPFFWLPLGTLAFVIVVSLLGLMVSGFGEFHFEMTSNQNETSFLFLDQWTDQQFDERMAGFRTLAALPFFLIYVVSALFVLLGMLYDDRKDRSVLFWKSMPVSDLETVTSKLVLVVWVAPLVTMTVIFLAQCYLLILGSFFVWNMELGDVSRIWSHAGLFGGIVQMLVGIFVQSLWALPVTGYLLLISATVPRLTLLWAILVPVVLSVTEFMVFRSTLISAWLNKHAEAAAIPTLGDGENRVMPVVRTIGDQVALLGNLDLWFGVLIGAAFVYGAAHMRGLKNEL